jgi:hypothetical protein
MRVYLDTEFNGFGGELISLALVPEGTLPSFYEVRSIPADVHPWVQQHVVPVLDKAPLGNVAFKDRVQSYLRMFTDGVEIIADWPEDICHMCAQMCSEGGKALMIFPTFRLVNTWGGGGGISRIPHNALEDARALRAWHVGY